MVVRMYISRRLFVFTRKCFGMLRDVGGPVVSDTSDLRDPSTVVAAVAALWCVLSCNVVFVTR